MMVSQLLGRPFLSSGGLLLGCDQTGNDSLVLRFCFVPFSPDASLYQYYMIVLQTFGVHYAQRYTSIGRVCRNICSISIECTNSSVFRVLYIRTQNYI